jgi:hypothetical protein
VTPLVRSLVVLGACLMGGVACTGPNPLFGIGVASQGGAPGGQGGQSGHGGQGGQGGQVPAAGGQGGGEDAAPAPDMAPALDAASADVPVEAGSTDVPAASDSLDLGAAMDRPVDTSSAPPRDTTAARLRYDFEAGVAEWQDIRWSQYLQSKAAPVTQATGVSYEGAHALKIELTTTGSYVTPTIGIQHEFGNQLTRGMVINYWVWVPADGSITAVQPFTIYYRPQDADGSPIWSGGKGVNKIYFTGTDLKAGEWNKVSHRVPDDVDARGVVELGVEWRTPGALSTTVYLDDVYF